MMTRIRTPFGASTSFSIRCLCLLLACALGAAPVQADKPEWKDKEENPFPPDDDPSAFTGPTFGDLDEELPEANRGSFEGGLTETSDDANLNNVLPEDFQRDDFDAVFNVPTNGPPSPLFGAEPFTQKMLRFE